MPQAIHGVLPVIHTPFCTQDRIDRGILRDEIDWAYQVGADGVVAAMVSEILYLSKDERIQLTQDLVEFSRGRGTVVVSIGAETAAQSLVFGQVAEDCGCDAVMAIPPISNSVTDEQLWDYFASIAESLSIPLVVQDASSYVGEGLTTEFYVRLLKSFGPEKILFKPEGAPIGPNLSALRDASGQQAKIFDGSGGALLIDAYRRGITGTMPGTDLLDGIVALWSALQAGDEERAYELYFPVCAIVNLQLQAGLDGFLAIEKYLLVKRGIFESARRRQPQWELDSETAAEVDRLFERLQNVLKP